MVYYTIRKTIQEGTSKNVPDRARMYKKILKKPTPGRTYKIPAIPEAEKPVYDPLKDPDYPWYKPPREHLDYSGIHFPITKKYAVKVWDRRGFGNQILQSTVFIEVPEEFRCNDVRVYWLARSMFVGTPKSAEEWCPGFIKDGCIAMPHKQYQELYKQVHEYLGCGGMTAKGWQKLIDDRCNHVRILYV